MIVVKVNDRNTKYLRIGKKRKFSRGQNEELYRFLYGIEMLGGTVRIRHHSGRHSEDGRSLILCPLIW